MSECVCVCVAHEEARVMLPVLTTGDKVDPQLCFPMLKQCIVIERGRAVGRVHAFLFSLRMT